ncbi:MAG: hypothetical protein WAZ44_04630, partial [Minisyncoccia bacterium]
LGVVQSTLEVPDSEKLTLDHLVELGQLTHDLVWNIVTHGYYQCRKNSWVTFVNLVSRTSSDLQDH